MILCLREVVKVINSISEANGGAVNAEFDPIAFNLENADRHLLDYLPQFLQQVQEFQAINAANEPEIKAAWQSLGRVLGNQFLAEADSGGLTVWERELGIFAKDTDTLALRRARIKAAWQRQPPYTMRWLRGWLDSLCGEDNYSLNVQDYLINILLEYERLSEPNALLREIVEVLAPVRPANMLLETVLQASPKQAEAHLGGVLVGSMSSTVLPQLVWEKPMQQPLYIAADNLNMTETALQPIPWQQQLEAVIHSAGAMGNITEKEVV